MARSDPLLAIDCHSMVNGKGVLLQLKSAKQLSVGGDDDGGEAHRNRPHAHREIESPVDEQASGDRNRDNVIGRRPHQVLDHFSIGGAGQFDRTHDIARIATHERTIPADSIATSVPAPMAIPTLAVASAGASFTPSPTMATRLPPA